MMENINELIEKNLKLICENRDTQIFSHKFLDINGKELTQKHKGITFAEEMASRNLITGETLCRVTEEGYDIYKNGGWLKYLQLEQNKRIKEKERESKKDEILDLDIQLKRFESKIGKKLILAGFVITLLSFLITIITLKFWNNEDELKNEQKPIIELTEFQNGRWLNTTDSLAGIEIKNGKWIMFYKGTETDSSDIYDFNIRREYIKELGTEHKPFKYLTLTNDSDTLDYSILEYSNELLSLSYILRGNTLNYEPEK